MAAKIQPNSSQAQSLKRQTVASWLLQNSGINQQTSSTARDTNVDNASMLSAFFTDLPSRGFSLTTQGSGLYTSPVIHVIVGEQMLRFSVYAAALEKSPVFKAVKNKAVSPINGTTKTLHLPDFTPLQFSVVLDYLYFGKASVPAAFKGILDARLGSTGMYGKHRKIEQSKACGANLAKLYILSFEYDIREFGSALSNELLRQPTLLTVCPAVFFQMYHDIFEYEFAYFDDLLRPEVDVRRGLKVLKQNLAIFEDPTVVKILHSSYQLAEAVATARNSMFREQAEALCKAQKRVDEVEKQLESCKMGCTTAHEGILWEDILTLTDDEVTPASTECTLEW
ncbi:hypothetical protein MMC25_004055 [Agyrium rufum]|nr:hypothetical protein [Agyrium rufum]